VYLSSKENSLATAGRSSIGHAPLNHGPFAVRACGPYVPLNRSVSRRAHRSAREMHGANGYITHMTSKRPSFRSSLRRISVMMPDFAPRFRDSLGDDAGVLAGEVDVPAPGLRHHLYSGSA
jgi:hypothetical protein